MLTSRLTSVVVIAVAFVCARPGAAFGQGRITGTVSDSAKRPIVDAEVFLRPIGRRARTDSLGRFSFSDLKNGTYVLVARRLGYAQDLVDLTLSKGGALTQNFVLARRVILDTVRVTDRITCPQFTFDGFFCRQQRRPGLFLDYPDIDEHGEVRTGDVFRHINGFRVSLRPTRQGVIPVPQRYPYRCTMLLVDGHLVQGWELVPRLTSQLSASELYLRPDSVPPEIQQEMRFTQNAMPFRVVKDCDAIVFWTVSAPLKATTLPRFAASQ